MEVIEFAMNKVEHKILSFLLNEGHLINVLLVVNPNHALDQVSFLEHDALIGNAWLMPFFILNVFWFLQISILVGLKIILGLNHLKKPKLDSFF